MAKSSGKNIALSPFRKIVTDLMHFSQEVPSNTADRRMDLAAVVEARQRCMPRPSWSGIFTKAYAMTARKYPELRRCFMKRPWPHLYEHPHNVAQFNIDRQLANERIVLYCLVHSPENQSLAEIDAIMRHHKNAPVEQLRSYRRALAMGRLPWFLRRWAWRGALNWSGGQRCRNFGTFGMSSIGAQGAGLLKLIPLLTSTLHFGLLDEQSRLDVRLSWDHRVMDGATVAEILVELESILNHEIVAEIRDAHQLSKAA